MESIFEGFSPVKCEAPKHGNVGVSTEAYKEATRRTKRVPQGGLAATSLGTGGDLCRCRSPDEERYAPADDAAMAVAERHRLLIDRWFYPCSLDTHRGLGEPLRKRRPLFGRDRRSCAGAHDVSCRGHPGQRGPPTLERFSL